MPGGDYRRVLQARPRVFKHRSEKKNSAQLAGPAICGTSIEWQVEVRCGSRLHGARCWMRAVHATARRCRPPAPRLRRARRARLPRRPPRRPTGRCTPLSADAAREALARPAAAARRGATRLLASHAGGRSLSRLDGACPPWQKALPRSGAADTAQKARPPPGMKHATASRHGGAPPPLRRPVPPPATRSRAAERRSGAGRVARL